jgi:hypothetical protein
MGQHRWTWLPVGCLTLAITGIPHLWSCHMNIGPQQRVRVDSFVPCTIDQANGVRCSLHTETTRDGAEETQECIYPQLAILLRHRESWLLA